MHLIRSICSVLRYRDVTMQGNFLIGKEVREENQ